MSFRLPGYLTMSGITVAMPEPYNAVVPLNIALSHPKDNRANLEMEVRNASADISSVVSFNRNMESSGLTRPIPISINGRTFAGGVWSNGGVPPYSGVNPYGSINIPGMRPGLLNSRVAVPQAGQSGYLDSADNDSAGAQFGKKLSLIEEYCDKWGKTVDVDEIKERFASDPEGGAAYCDDILNNKFNQSRLRKIVHKKYDDYNKSREEAGRAVSDKWVDSVLKKGLGALEVDAKGVTKDNVLDVIGTFATNKQVKNGKVSLYNVFESPKMTQDMINVLKQRADETLQRKDVTDDDKARILSSIESLRANYDKYDESLDTKNPLEFKKVRGALEKSYMDLFGSLRMHEAKHNDEVAPQYYGLPKDSEIKFNDQTQRAQEEISSYKNRRKLSTKI